MKKTSIAFLLIVLLFPGCTKDSENSTLHKTGVIPETVDSLNYMRFERQGGGQIDFKLYLTSNSDNIESFITRYNFRDTTIIKILTRNTTNDSIFTHLDDALMNKIELSGGYQQPTSLTGSWARVYISKEGIETEVTNTSLRNSLIQFERIVMNYL